MLRFFVPALANMIVDQLRLLDSPSLLSPRGANKVPAEDPKHLAIALTILEGDRYKRILPGECVAYLRRQFDQTELDSTQRPAFKAKHWVRPDFFSIRRRRLVISRTTSTSFVVRTTRLFSGLKTLFSDQMM
jgi:hypothetical protein